MSVVVGRCCGNGWCFMSSKSLCGHVFFFSFFFHIFLFFFCLVFWWTKKAALAFFAFTRYIPRSIRVFLFLFFAIFPTFSCFLVFLFSSEPTCSECVFLCAPRPISCEHRNTWETSPKCAVAFLVSNSSAPSLLFFCTTGGDFTVIMSRFGVMAYFDWLSQRPWWYDWYARLKR